MFHNLWQYCSQFRGGHHRYILDKCKDVDKALFFARKIHKNNWSRDVLLNIISTDLYEREGKVINNFELSLPDENKDLAKQITKDPYNFDFLTITNEYNEKELKDAFLLYSFLHHCPFRIFYVIKHIKNRKYILCSFSNKAKKATRKSNRLTTFILNNILIKV